jgi:hypothetical protein
MWRAIRDEIEDLAAWLGTEVEFEQERKRA